MVVSDFDVVIIGMGIGACSVAKRLAEASIRVGMLPGAGRPRFTHIDGGMIDPILLERAFGDVSSAPITGIGDRTVFRRDQLESWAVERTAGVVSIIDGFEETRVSPNESGDINIIGDTGLESIAARYVMLMEGANPKIGIATHLREDFAPEDMIHIARVMIQEAHIPEPKSGIWRTSWGMPAGYSLMPQAEGILVSATARIENIMRAGRDARDAVTDLITGPLGQELGISDASGDIGIELVPLKRVPESGTLGRENLMIALDANGTLDARSLLRYNNSLGVALEMGTRIASAWPDFVDWDDTDPAIWSMFTTLGTPYHDDKSTGFIEDGPEPYRSVLSRLFNR